MAKNVKYDRQEVIEKATRLYWEKGFHGTSMRNLQDIIDMRPGSIYASFGSKEGLFKEALGQYAQMGIELLNSCKQNSPSLLGALKLFIKKSLIDNRASAPSGLCMLAKTVSELTEENAELLAEAKHLLSTMESHFSLLLSEAQTNGEIDASKDCQQLARFIQIQIMGLRSYARINNEIAEIDEVMDEMIENIFKYYPFK